MSIIIKGMRMPKNCETCELSSTDSSGFFGCCVTGNIVLRKREQERPTWCPLVELPPHGRLIDADALHIPLIDKELDQLQPWTSFDDYREVLQMIDDAPTIIESEGEE